MCGKVVSFLTPESSLKTLRKRTPSRLSLRNNAAEETSPLMNSKVAIGDSCADSFRFSREKSDQHLDFFNLSGFPLVFCSSAPKPASENVT